MLNNPIYSPLPGLVPDTLRPRLRDTNIPKIEKLKRVPEGDAL